VVVVRRLLAFGVGVVVISAGCADAEPQPAAPPVSLVETSPVTSTSSVPVSATTAPATVSVPESGLTTPDGFALVPATVTGSDGSVCELCLWLADTGDRRSRGLMGVTGLGNGDGMAFVYPSPTTGQFWMKDTLLPLSIAFFAPDGSYLDAFDMEPCSVEPCARYGTPPDFLVAVETVRGDLPAIGIAPGSTLDLDPSHTCPPNSNA
jgi:uncharacterized membrane protein (UPF0127 family)